MKTTPAQGPTLRRAALFATRAILIGSISIRMGVLSHAVTINSTYIGPYDGAWENAANWSPAQIPGDFGSTLFNVIGNNSESVLLSTSRTIQNLDLSNGTDLTLASAAAPVLLTVSGSTNLDYSEGSSDVHVRAGSGDATMNLGTLANLVGSTEVHNGGYELESTGAGFATLRVNNAAITIIHGAYVSLIGANTRITNQAGVDALTNLNRIDNGGSLEIGWGRNFTTSGNFRLGTDSGDEGGALTVRTSSNASAEINTTFTVSGSLANYSAATSTLTRGYYQVESGNGGQFARIRFANTGITTLWNASVILSGSNAFLTNLVNQDALTNLSAVVEGGYFALQNGHNFTTAGNFTIGASYFNPATFEYTSGASLSIATSDGGQEHTTTFTVNGSLSNYNAATKTLTGGSYDIDASSTAVTAAFRFANTGITKLQNTHLALSGANAQITNLASQDALAALAMIDSDSSLRLAFGRNLSTPGNFTNDGSLSISASGYPQEAPTVVLIGGTLTNFNPATKAIAGGSFDLQAGSAGSAATLKFTGADIVTNRSSITLEGANAKIVNELNQDALRNLAVNADDSYLSFTNGHNFTTVGNFTNLGQLTIATGDEPGTPTSFVVSGSFTNFNAVTKTLTGGFLSMDDYGSGLAATFQFPNADIQTNRSSIYVAGPNSKIVNQVGADALANLNFNDTSGSLHFSEGHNYVTSGNFTNAGVLGGNQISFTISGNFSNTGTVDLGSYDDGVATVFAVAGLFTNYNGTSKILTGGQISLSAYGAGANTTFQFPGADIRTNRSSIFLAGPLSKITNQTGADALANLNLNDSSGFLSLSNGKGFISAGNFVNAGSFYVQNGGSATISGNYTNSGLTSANGNGIGTVFRVVGTITNTSTGLLDGNGAFEAGQIINDGVIRAEGDLSVTAASIMGNGSLEAASSAFLSIDAATIDTDAISVSPSGRLALRSGLVTTSSLTIGDGGVVVFGDGPLALSPVFSAAKSTVPEPGSAALLTSGLVVCLGCRRRGT